MAEEKKKGKIKFMFEINGYRIWAETYEEAHRKYLKRLRNTNPWEV